MPPIDTRVTRAEDPDLTIVEAGRLLDDLKIDQTRVGRAIATVEKRLDAGGSPKALVERARQVKLDIAALRRRATEAEDAAVFAAVEAGASYQEVGAWMGATKAFAAQRYQAHLARLGGATAETPDETDSEGGAE